MGSSIDPAVAGRGRWFGRRVTASSHASGRWYSLIALLLVAIASPAILAVQEWTAFAQSQGVKGGWHAVAIPWVFFAATQWMLAIGTLGAALLMWVGWRKSGWLVFLGWLLVIYTAAEADRQTYVRTNVHLRDYASLVRTPGAKQWAGNVQITRYLFSLVEQAARDLVAVPLVAGIAIAWFTRRYATLRAAKRLAIGLMITLLIGVVGVVPAQRVYADRAMLARAHAQLPFDFRWFAPGVHFVDTNAFAKTFDRLLSAKPRRVARGTSLTTNVAMPSDARRDVLLIVVESLRVDAMTPDVMPRTCALAANGMRLMQHASGAKYTQFALYNLLSARPALKYAADADANAPMAAETFRHLGYATQYIGSSDFHWRGLDRFLDTRIFDRLRNVPLADWPLADHLVLKAAREDSSTRAAAPRFTVAYLVSTHFPYAFPERFATRLPQVSAQRSILAMDEATDRPGLINRYHNACSFLDDEIATLVANVDLTRTVVAITGDHGESFWDDRSLTHGGRWSDAVVHVPCVLIGAGVPQGMQFDRATCHQDVVPTLLRLGTGRHVSIVGSIGRDVFEPTSGDDVRLLCSESSAEYGQALFERGDRRLLVEFTRGRRNAIVLGSVDRQGNVDPYDTPPAADASAWAAGVTRLFKPLNETVAR